MSTTTTKTLQARNVRAGDEIETSAGMRRVARVEPMCWENGKPYAVRLHVDFWGTIEPLFHRLDEPVLVRRTESAEQVAEREAKAAARRAASYGTLFQAGEVKVVRTPASSEGYNGERHYYPATLEVRVPDASIHGRRVWSAEGRLTKAALAEATRIAQALHDLFGESIRYERAAVAHFVKSITTTQEEK